jgi:hypothetical protein
LEYTSYNEQYYASFLFETGDYNGWDLTVMGETYLYYESGSNEGYRELGFRSLHLYSDGPYIGYFDNAFDGE